jgi:hypothetical protein
MEQEKAEACLPAAFRLWSRAAEELQGRCGGVGMIARLGPVATLRSRVSGGGNWTSSAQELRDGESFLLV